MSGGLLEKETHLSEMRKMHLLLFPERKEDIIKIEKEKEEHQKNMMNALKKDDMNYFDFAKSGDTVTKYDMEKVLKDMYKKE